MRAWPESASDGARVEPGTAPRCCALFGTAIGDCGLAWNARALTQVLLPAASAGHTLALLRRLARDAAVAEPPWPDFVAAAVAGMQALLAGEAASLNAVPLQWARVGAFERRVYEAAQRLGPGQTCTYGELARAIGEPDAARAVGAALGRNPWPLVVPCHRVLAAGGQMGGFSAPGGAQTKRWLLAIEAVHARREGELF